MGLRHTNQAKSFFSGRRGNSGPLNLFHRFVNVCQECQAELEKAKAAAEQKRLEVWVWMLQLCVGWCFMLGRWAVAIHAMKRIWFSVVAML